MPEDSGERSSPTSILHSAFSILHSSQMNLGRQLRILYFLEDTDLSGGVRVILAQADALVALGHHVTIATKGAPLTWRSSQAEWMHVDDFSQIEGTWDFAIGTFYPTVPHAFRIAGPRALHLCQGYEGAISYYRELVPIIESIYDLPIPKLVVSENLIETCTRFTSEVVNIGQIVDDEFFRPAAPERQGLPRVLLSGPAQIDLKGIDDGYGAAAHARAFGGRFELIRVSPWAPSGAEPVDIHVQEFHVALSAAAMTRLVHSCDIVLAPGHAEEGFGLPAAEGMAAGLAAVLTRIPSYLSFDTTHDYARFAEAGDAEQLGDELLQLLEDDDLRDQVARRGREVAEKFRSEHVGRRLEEYLLSRDALLP